MNSKLKASELVPIFFLIISPVVQKNWWADRKEHAKLTNRLLCLVSLDKVGIEVFHEVESNPEEKIDDKYSQESFFEVASNEFEVFAILVFKNASAHLGKPPRSKCL